MLVSILVTAKQQGKVPLTYLKEVLLAKEGQPPPLFEWASPVAQPV